VELYKNKQRENFKIYLVLPEIKSACVPQIEGKWPMYCSNQLAFIFTNNMEDKTKCENALFREVPLSGILFPNCLNK